jgi:hypothetical protein
MEERDQIRAARRPVVPEHAEQLPAPVAVLALEALAHGAVMLDDVLLSMRPWSLEEARELRDLELRQAVYEPSEGCPDGKARL